MDRTVVLLYFDNMIQLCRVANTGKGAKKDSRKKKLYERVGSVHEVKYLLNVFPSNMKGLKKSQ